MKTVNKDIGQLDTQPKATEANREAVEAEILIKVNEFHDTLELRKAELIRLVNEETQQRLKELAARRRKWKSFRPS